MDTAFGGSKKEERGLLASLGVEEGAGLGEEEEEEEEEAEGEEQEVEHTSWLVTVLAGCVGHGGRVREEGGGEVGGCERVTLGEECLCQEVAVR